MKEPTSLSSGVDLKKKRATYIVDSAIGRFEFWKIDF